MTHNSDYPRLYIAVDASKVVRCAWCGTIESTEWKPVRDAIFCSDDCMMASSTRHSWFWGFLTLFATVIFVWAFLVVPDYQKGAVAVVGSICVIFGLGYLISSLGGQEYARRVPRNSRRSEGSDEGALLRTITSPLECPNCDANLDVSRVSDDMHYHCEYCGATGVVEFLSIVE